MDREAEIAWVESPLQLLGAADWAAVHRRRVPVVGRLTARMSETAEELLARGEQFRLAGTGLRMRRAASAREIGAPS